MKHFISLLSTFFLSAPFLFAQKNTKKEYHLLIGTYAASGKPNGIHVYRFNTETGDFSQEQPVTELSNASYLAVSDDRKNVYAVSEAKNGSLNAYAFDASTGTLKFLNKVPTVGSAYVSVDKGKTMAVTANYDGGSVTVAPLASDGSLIEGKARTIQHEGSSVNKQRQDKPHVHSVVWSPDKKYLFAPDLGTDRVYQYRPDIKSSELLLPAQPAFITIDSIGGGPRHLTFHPNGKWAYLVLEMKGAVMAFDYGKGKLKAKQTISMVSPDFTGTGSGADIHISPDGKFLYASNRGRANEIAIYSINKKGELTMIGRQSVLGRTPRNFAITPGGEFLLVANQDTNEIIIFKRDQKTGMLSPTGSKIEVSKPVCLKFVEAGE
ncbi:MAG: lactonase family protein [Chitinophagaceae bacterium]